MDDGHIGLELLIIFVLIFLNGVFSMTEIAVVGARKTKLREMAKKGNTKAEYALRIAENPENLFSTIQIGITAIGILTGMFSGATLAGPLAAVLEKIPALSPYAEGLSMTIVMVTVSYATLILGELAPKWLAIAKSEEMSCLVAKPMVLFAKICYPLILFSNWSTKVVIKLIGVDMQEEKPVSEEEIHALLLQGAGMGTFDKAEPVLVDRVFQLDDLTAADCMTTRTRLEWIDIEETEEEIWQALDASIHYRLPVGHGSLDEFIGIIDIRDVLRDHHKNAPDVPIKESIHRCIRQAIFIPETLTLLKILQTFREKSTHEAIVIDEYGTLSGYICLHDILEEIVGDMPRDAAEKREDSNRILKRADGSFLVEGLCTIDDFREYFHIEEELPGEAEDYYKTLGGFIVYLFGNIPKETEVIEYDRFHFEIVDLDGRRIDKILVQEKETA